LSTDNWQLTPDNYMSSSCHPWLAVGFTLYLTAAVFVSIRGFRRHTHPLPASVHEWVGQWMRTALALFEPTLIKFGIRPIFLTFAQLGLSLLAGIAYASGLIFLGGWLMLACGVLDLLDGGVARRTAQASRRGAFLDSVIDRYAEFFTFCGLGIFFSASWVVWVVALGFLGSMMVSYARARAEGLGVECRGGLMQRGERYVFLGVTSFSSTVVNHLSCRPGHAVLILGLLLMTALTNLTALSRIRTVSAALGGG